MAFSTRFCGVESVPETNRQILCSAGENHPRKTFSRPRASESWARGASTDSRRFPSCNGRCCPLDFEEITPCVPPSPENGLDQQPDADTPIHSSPTSLPQVKKRNDLLPRRHGLGLGFPRRLPSPPPPIPAAGRRALQRRSSPPLGPPISVLDSPSSESTGPRPRTRRPRLRRQPETGAPPATAVSSYYLRWRPLHLLRRAQAPLQRRRLFVEDGRSRAATSSSDPTISVILDNFVI